MKSFFFALCGLLLLSQPSMAYEKEINSVSAEMAEKIAGSGKQTNI